MKFLFDFIPILVFFLAYKFFGIYIATGVAIVVTILQVGYGWFKHRRVETLQIITLVLILLLGGATIWLHNETFIKWKPSILYWILSVFFLSNHFFAQEPIIKRILGHNINLPEPIWSRLNLSWGLFFAAVGFANFYVMKHFSTDTWVNFKLFGILGITFLFVILQAFYLARHIKIDEDKS